MNIVFVGNVDSGKSTLCGQLLLPTLDERTMQQAKDIAKQNKKESFWLAYLLDTEDFERTSGITTDFAKIKTSYGYTILDCPGHKDFIPKMIQGASMANAAVLVVSCKNGEYERSLKGQTTEHALLIYTLGITKIIVAINKMDCETHLSGPGPGPNLSSGLVSESDSGSCTWNEKRYQFIVEDLSKILKNIGFRVKKEVSFIPISAYTGIGVHSNNPMTHVCLNDILKSLKIDKEEYTNNSILVVNGIENVDESNKKNIICSIFNVKETSEVAESKIYLNSVKNISLITNELKKVDINDTQITFETNEHFCLYDIITNKKICYNKLLISVYIIDSLITVGFSANIHINGLYTMFEVLDIYANFEEKLLKEDKKNLKNLKKIVFGKSKEKVILKIKLTDTLPIPDIENMNRVFMRSLSKTIAIGKIILKSNF